jgi:hypothetical protein
MPGCPSWLLYILGSALGWILGAVIVNLFHRIRGSR